MKRHDEIEQGSIEWFEIKWGRIGGTLSNGLFVNSDTLFLDILSQRSEEADYGTDFTTYAMERGNELEPIAREYLKKETGHDFKEAGWLQCEENDLLGLSPDGITESNENSCEIKCFGRKKHQEVIYYNEIPIENRPQCLHYFTVNPMLKTHTFIAFRPEAKKHFIQVLTPDSLMDLGIKKKIEVPQFGVKGQEIKPKIATVPDIRTIKEWVEVSKQKANELLERITEQTTELMGCRK